jgi:hypothetical protein
MQRRTALRQLATLLGGLTLTPEIMARTLASAASGAIPQHLGADKMAILAEIAETIIPETDTPGAKAAGVPGFIALMLEDCTAPAEQEVFWAGLDAAEQQCMAMFGTSIVNATATQRITLLTQIEKAASSSPNFWEMVKGLTLFGYFSSEIGMTQALAFDPIPGGWIPEMPIDENTKAWASMF